MSMIFPFFRADAFSIWKSKKEKCKIYDTETNKTDAVKLFEAAENLGISNGTVNEIIYELYNKIKDLEEINKTVRTELENLKIEINNLRANDKMNAKIFFCIGLLIGVLLFKPAWQLLDTATRQIVLWESGVFCMEQVNRRVKNLEDNYDFLSERFTNLAKRLTKKV